MNDNTDYLDRARRRALAATGTLLALWAFFLVIVVGLTVHFWTGKPEWSDDLKVKLAEACLVTDTAAQCDCMMKGLTQDFSEKEFMRFASRDMSDALAIVNYHLLKCEMRTR